MDNMGMNNCSSSNVSVTPLTLTKSVGDAAVASAPTRSLRFVMLGCEDHQPYGPTNHTGALFMEMITSALEMCDSGKYLWNVSIDIFRVQQGEYPEDWDAYVGILLPGSFAAAYEDFPWIEKLKKVIQTEIVPKRRPTLGVCFGHQVFAHSFDTGKAIKNSDGSRGGRFAMKTTKEGSSFFGGQEAIELYYTHGDLVAEVPSCAVILGQEGPGLPVQAAAYFKDAEEAKQFQSASGSASTKIRPYAVTIQAHPEYAVSRELGLSFTLQRILKMMAEKKLLESEVHEKADKDSIEQFDLVQQHSLSAFTAAAKALGWFP